MDSTHTIRDAVLHVGQLRQIAAATPGLARAVSDIKQLQARRFAGSYADLLDTDRYRAAARFFLEELYSAKDYSGRDAQFARIAGTLERLFPQQVVQTAVALAQVHRLSEELDLAMAQQAIQHPDKSEVARYIAAWRVVDRRADRYAQLTTVIRIGQELDRLTRTPGLRLMLKMMRRPANLAGLGALQQFLEAGFDTFAAMGRQGEGAQHFLEIVQARETRLIDLLFDGSAVACETELAQLLGQAR